jgi:ActR/RegA family two-component response regulator
MNGSIELAPPKAFVVTVRYRSFGFFMNQRRVLDVGNCGPYHTSIRRMLTTNFGAEVIQTHGLDDTLAALQKNFFDLVLINRKLDNDYSDGTVILERIKTNPEYSDLSVMLITNYPEHQANAVALGALPGFGKLEIDTPETRAKLAKVLSKVG